MKALPNWTRLTIIITAAITYLIVSVTLAAVWDGALMNILLTNTTIACTLIIYFWYGRIVAPNEEKNLRVQYDLLEKISSVFHDAWASWSTTTAREEPISKERRALWNERWTEYDKLTDEMKEHDRKHARKVLAILREKRES